RAAPRRPSTPWPPRPVRPCPARSCPHSIEPRPQRGAIERQLGNDLAVDGNDGNPLQVRPQQPVVGLDVDLAKLETEALLAQRGDGIPRLIAEVAVRPSVE